MHIAYFVCVYEMILSNMGEQWAYTAYGIITAGQRKADIVPLWKLTGGREPRLRDVRRT